VKALRIAIRRPKSTKAMKMESDVKSVRSLRRPRFDKTNGRNFMPRLPDQPSLVL
jgi:hypothetical protein